MLVLGEVVGQPARPRVHLGAAERLVVRLLAGRHLDQRRAAEEHLGLLAHHHGVVGHAGDVGPARGRVAEDQRHRGHLGRRRAGDVAEELAAGDEDLLLRRQVRAAGLDERDGRQPVLLGDLRGAEDLADGPGVAGAALHGRVVGGDHALDALDDPDAGDDRGADGEVGPPAGQRRQLEERAARVDEELDPLAGQQLAPGVVALDVPLATTGHGDGVLGVEVGDLVQHRLAALDRHVAHASTSVSTTAFIRSSVVRMPLTLVRDRSGPRTSQ